MTYSTEVIQKAAISAGFSDSDVKYLIHLLSPTQETIKYHPLDLEALFLKFCRSMDTLPHLVRGIHRKQSLCDLRGTFCELAKEFFPDCMLYDIGEVINRDAATVYHSLKIKDQPHRVELLRLVKRKMGIF